jgi:hypothetical protein
MLPALGAPVDRSGYALEVEDLFPGPSLDERLWLPCYLPHWSSRRASAARYEVGGGLRLRIDADQPAWSPEWNGALRVSSLQTGLWAGPVGSPRGQHRFRPDLEVREAQPALALYTPRYGLFELRCRAVDDPASLGALWMIGLEDEPERSGELCICELFGREVGPAGARVGMGIHPFGDPALREEFELVPVAIDARSPHDYAAEWTPEGVAFYVDQRCVKVVRQSPAYPMQLMLNVYEFREGEALPSPPDRYPKRFAVDWFRGWRPAAQAWARPGALAGR